MKQIIIFNLLYRWKYVLAKFKAKFITSTKSKPTNTLTYVAREADKDWIFGAKVRRLSKYSSLNATPYFHNRLRNLPESDGYYFIHPYYFCRAIRHNPKILKRKNIVMFTHPDWSDSYSGTHVAYCLNLADYVICLNSSFKELLMSVGVKEEKLKIIHIASDPDFFYPHNRNKGAVGFCSNYGPRKSPELTYQIIKNMPEKHFYIIGRNWEKFEKFNELSNLPNFTYFNNYDYSEYPNLYNKIDTFISPSNLEGGPVPVLEAMLANCVPVASKTGFCPDVIEHGKNGFLFDIDANYTEVIELIKKADTMNTDIRATALAHSWANCSKKIDELFTN